MNINKIKQIINEQTEFSGVIQISKGDEILLDIAMGYARLFDKIPNRTDTSFGIASGTKGFTALAILKLIDAGKLNLEDNIFEILPYDFPNVKTPMTVKQLLTHTSGIYDYFDEEVIEDFGELFKIVPINKILGPKDMLPMIITGDCYFAPGEQFKYCNSGYVVLGMLIEVVSGMSYSDYLNENIIKPLKLTGTGCYKTNQLPPNTAIGYLKDKDKKWCSNIFEIPMACTADGGLFTTTDDVRIMWNGFIKGNLISEKLKIQALAKQVKRRSSGYYGLGFFINNDETCKTKTYELVGGDPGVSFSSIYFIENDCILTIISNTELDAWDLGQVIRKHL